MIDAITYLSLVVGTFCVSVLLGMSLGFWIALSAVDRYAKHLEVEQREKLRAA
jgi:uncharacterized protein YneF (UPF0154 family)